MPETNSTLGMPETNSTLGMPETNSTLGIPETDPIIQIPNATESWKFESSVNGSQFVGEVFIDESGLVLEGDGYVANDGNSTSQLGNLTITVWVKPDYSAGSSEFTIVSKEKSFKFSINNNIVPQKVAKFSIFDGIKWYEVETSTPVGENWSHLAATFNGTTLSIYTNGTLSNEQLTKVTIALVNIDKEFETPEIVKSTSDVIIGASLDNTRSVNAVAKTFSGEINDVNIFDVYLNAQQIAEIYYNTLQLYIETNSTEQTEEIESISLEEIETIDILLGESITDLTNTNNVTTNSNNNTNILLNGTDSYVIVTEEKLNDEINQITISTWIKPEYNHGSPEYTVISKENSFVLSVNNIISPEHVTKFSVFNGISWTEIIGSTQIENWSHLMAIINDTTLSLYVNGTLEGKAVLPETFVISGGEIGTIPADVADSDSDIVVGAYINTLRESTSNVFSGEISNVKIYKNSLTEQQVIEIFLKEFDNYFNSEINSLDQEPIIFVNGNGTTIQIYESLSLTENISVTPTNNVITIQVYESLSLTENISVTLTNNVITTESFIFVNGNVTTIQIYESLSLTENISVTPTNNVITIQIYESLH